jgi:hypothetical protein
LRTGRPREVEVNDVEGEGEDEEEGEEGTGLVLVGREIEGALVVDGGLTEAEEEGDTDGGLVAGWEEVEEEEEEEDKDLVAGRLAAQISQARYVGLLVKVQEGQDQDDS